MSVIYTIIYNAKAEGYALLYALDQSLFRHSFWGENNYAFFEFKALGILVEWSPWNVHWLQCQWNIHYQRAQVLYNSLKLESYKRLVNEDEVMLKVLAFYSERKKNALENMF